MRARSSSPSLSFRLPEAIHSQLSAAATASGQSIGELARVLLVAAVQDEDRYRVLNEVQEVRRELARLRGDLATVLETVLLNVTKASEESVRAWVGEKLRK